MSKFRYLARSLVTGQNVQGHLEASSKEMVLDRLYFQGLKVIEVAVVEKNLFERVDDFFSRVKKDSLIIFIRQISTLIKAGIPLFKSMQTVITQTEDVRFKKILEQIKKDIAEGSSLAKAMAAHPQVFSNFFINMVSVGENRGQLDEAFLRILKFEEKLKEIRNKIISALTYPALLFMSGIGVLVAMVVFVLPKFAAIFKQSEIALPRITQILIQVSNFVSSQFGWIVSALVLFIVGSILFFRTSEGLRAKDYLSFKMPIFGPIIHHAALLRFTRTLGTLYQSGVPLIHALELSKDSLNNRVIAEDVDVVIESVRDGKGIAEPLRKSKLFPQMMVQMISVGEESGSLDEMSIKVADFYEQEIEYKIKNQMALLEPIALIVIAVIVAFIAVAILLPMFKMAGSLRRL